MAIQIALHHRTRYEFDRTIQLSPHEIRLRPAAHSRTAIPSYSLSISPSDYFLNWQQDPHGNFVARLVFSKPTRYLTIEVDLIANMTVINPFDFFVEPYAEIFPFEYPDMVKKELALFLEPDSPGPIVHQWLNHFRTTHPPHSTAITDFLVNLNRRIHQEVQYIIRHEPGIQTCEETLASAKGSCRDSAWLLVQLLRHLGLAARFVSGYLVQLAPDVPPLTGPAEPKEDIADLHAWAEAYIPGAGWIGLDATSGLLAGEGHIPLACTAIPGSAAPVIGKTESCESSLQFSMTVTRIHEDPRVTKPYTDLQWQHIETVAKKVDQELAQSDVRLTMGGEPTFVSLEHLDEEEWNFRALSPTKRRIAYSLIKQLHRRWAPGGLLQSGQGKWYPGEERPRWVLSCYWREDGQPVWRDSEWLADETREGTCSMPDVQIFLARVARAFNLPPDCLIPAYEDPWPHLFEEQQLPDNIDPLQTEHQNSPARANLARVFSEGLGKIAGYVLPLKPQKDGPTNRTIRWQTCRWPFRRKHLFLLPGDSPLGFRLPLSALPWIDPKNREIDPERDPFENRESLESFPQGETDSPDSSNHSRESSERNASTTSISRGIIHTALCGELRQGRITLFAPPVPHLEDFLELVTCIEDTAKACNMPVILEGYPPPTDPRLRVLSVTPDPGVIEINVPPARSWEELSSMTTGLYEEARLAKLGAEKFQLDGRHTGTGGGNHITIGGPTPRESPVLRRPDFLKSMILYWQNHPALSYLFSGQFVGPTSQAPRIDEARLDSLYELTIAFQQLSEHVDDRRQTPLPWFTDRLLRHLLVDVTGNTHRAEFCIDKLYTPDRASGRLGLVELRAFEMPPHARMSLVQMVLIRALVARFWTCPYNGHLIPWGTDLHDRFMLPHFIEEDMKDIVLDLQEHGFSFQLDWFAPFLEFRFPLYGTVMYHGMQLALRQAIEPWLVLGEEVQATGTSRAVDSSVERLQIKLNNFTDARYLITCNGRPVPLVPTGTTGEFVAGIRFRAWQPPSCLHPTIPIQSPLVFDIVDVVNHRSVGGCTYHVSHPGGRNYQIYPVNAHEAEGRRHARFWNHGHTPGPCSIVRESPNRNFPCTLDLRLKPEAELA